MRSSFNNALFALLPLAVAQIAVEDIAAVGEAIKVELVATDRFSNLPNDLDFVFDFLNPPGGLGVTSGDGGHTVAATPTNFPLLTGLGIAMTVGFLGPCGMNTPHTHPRAAEINIAINGTLRTGLISENGARLVSHDLQAGQMTVFQAGAIHFEQNTECEPVTFVAAFNSEDPGVAQVAQRFFSLPKDVLSAVFNDLPQNQVVELANMIPDNVALGTDDCLKRCGITRPSTISQKQINSPAPDITGGPGPGQPASTATSKSSTGKAALNNQNLAANPVPNASSSPASNSSSSKNNGSDLTPFLIALCVINGIFLVGATAAGVYFFVYRKKNTVGRHTPLSYDIDYQEKEVMFSPGFASPGFSAPPPGRNGAYDPPVMGGDKH